MTDSHAGADSVSGRCHQDTAIDDPDLEESTQIRTRIHVPDLDGDALSNGGTGRVDVHIGRTLKRSALVDHLHEHSLQDYRLTTDAPDLDVPVDD